MAQKQFMGDTMHNSLSVHQLSTSGRQLKDRPKSDVWKGRHSQSPSTGRMFYGLSTNSFTKGWWTVDTPNRPTHRLIFSEFAGWSFTAVADHHSPSSRLSRGYRNRYSTTTTRNVLTNQALTSSRICESPIGLQFHPETGLNSLAFMRVQKQAGFTVQEGI